MYDLHNHILLKQNSVNMKELGFSAAGVVFSDKEKPDFEKLRELKQSIDIDLISGVEIHAARPGEVKKALDKFRNNVDVIFVDAKDPRAYRAAAADSRVDVIAHAFVDQTTVRDAADNNVALEINLRDMLAVYGMKRSHLISKINFNLNLARKYKTPIVISTGAKDIYDLRSAKQIMALAECIGFTHEEAKKALLETPKKIVEKNRNRKQGVEVGEGVKVVKRN